MREREERGRGESETERGPARLLLTTSADEREKREGKRRE